MMKKLLFLLLFPLLAIPAKAQVSGFFDEALQSQTGEFPKYLLLVRTVIWGEYAIVAHSYTTLSPTTEIALPVQKEKIKYAYHYLGFDSKDAVLKALEGQTEAEYIVGLWQLADSKRIPINLTVTHHKKEEKVKIEVQEWDEYKWEVEDK